MALYRGALTDAIRRQHEREPFSGVIDVCEGGEVVFTEAFGLAQRAERIANTLGKRFAIASGTKTLTSIAVLQLVDAGRVALDTRLVDCVDVALLHIDPKVTLHHLLCHAAGVPDYFDEAVMDDSEALWRDRPMYGMRAPRDFLPLFAHLPMKASPGTTWVYNHAGYLPTEDGGWRTNAYSVPIVGGPDGGAYTTTADLAALWDALLGGRLLRQVTLERMLTPHWRTGPGDGEGHYGYGIWIAQCGGRTAAYTMVGEDPGVVCFSTLRPGCGVVASLLGNAVEASQAMWRAITPIVERSEHPPT